MHEQTQSYYAPNTPEQKKVLYLQIVKLYISWLFFVVKMQAVPNVKMWNLQEDLKVEVLEAKVKTSMVQNQLSNGYHDGNSHYLGYWSQEDHLSESSSGHHGWTQSLPSSHSRPCPAHILIPDLSKSGCCDNSLKIIFSRICWTACAGPGPWISTSPSSCSSPESSTSSDELRRFFDWSPICCTSLWWALTSLELHESPSSLTSL